MWNFYSYYIFPCYYQKKQNKVRAVLDKIQCWKKSTELVSYSQRGERVAIKYCHVFILQEIKLFLQQITKYLPVTSSPILKGNLMSIFHFVQKTTAMSLTAGQNHQEMTLRMVVQRILHYFIDNTLVKSHWKKAGISEQFFSERFLLQNKSEWHLWLASYLQIRKLDCTK